MRKLPTFASREEALAFAASDPVLGPLVEHTIKARIEMGDTQSRLRPLIAGLLMGKAEPASDGVELEYVAEMITWMSKELPTIKRLDELAAKFCGRSVDDVQARVEKTPANQAVLALFKDGSDWVTLPGELEIEDAVEDLIEGTDAGERGPIWQALDRLLRFLATEGVIGPLRAERLIGIRNRCVDERKIA